MSDAGKSQVQDSVSNINEYQKQKNNFFGSRARPVDEADNLTIICELIVNAMWGPQHLTTL
jgi:hypothetical protein